MKVRIAYLDRDGTINVDSGYVYRWDDWQFVAGAVEGLRLLHQCGFQLAVVTNQGGIARGYYTERDVLTLHQQMTESLRAEGIPLAAIAYCPHAAGDRCPCRKPAIGLAEQIATTLHAEVDYRDSWMIGDKLSDLQFGKSLGVRTALIESRYWLAEQILDPPDIVSTDLLAAAREIAKSGGAGARCP